MQYEATFSAQVANYHSHGKVLVIFESIMAIMLLAGSNLDDIKRIPIVTNESPSKPVGDTDTDFDIVSRLKYDLVASILRKRDNKNNLFSNNNAKLFYTVHSNTSH